MRNRTMIFQFDTISDKTTGNHKMGGETTRSKAKRLGKDLRQALTDNASLRGPMVSNVTMTTITAVTVYPY